MTEGAWAPWAAVLERLEADVSRAEQLAGTPDLDATPIAWHQPALDVPIPAGLVGRARDLLDRQTRAQEALAVALTATVRQQEFTNRVDRATGRTESAKYLDVSA